MLPLWFSFRSVSSSALSEEDQRRLVTQRVKLLADKVPGRILKKEPFESDEEFEQRANEELFGHGLLRLAAATDMKVASWLVETEGDLFSLRFKAAPLEEKMEVIDFLFPDEGALSLSALNRYLGEDIGAKFHLSDRPGLHRRDIAGRIYAVKDKTGLREVIGIRYTLIPEVLKLRRHILYQGWVIGRIDELLSVIKRKFEKLLSDRIESIGEKIEKSHSLSNQATFILEMLENEETKPLIKPKYESFSIENIELNGSIEDNLLLLPPCIQDLVHKVNKTGYLSHWQRFQLGIFLKVTGMPMEEQLRYWYNKAVDNIGLSFEEFSNRAGYIIKHIYGLVGGKIDYTMPSCKTIQDKMHCTFKHNNIETISKRLSDIVEQIKEPGLKESRMAVGKNVLAAAYRFEHGRACRQFLNFITGDLSNSPPFINHPMMYLKLSQSRGVVFTVHSAVAPKREGEEAVEAVTEQDLGGETDD